MSITLKEIAKLANVSATTVSLVLNNKPCRISNETQKKIRAIAKEHHYKANPIARSLATKKSNSLGLLIPNIENTYFSNITKSISSHTQGSGYSLLLTHSNDTYTEDLHLIKELINRGVEGLFLVLSDSTFTNNHFDQIYNLLENSSIPYILIDRIPFGYACNKIYVDNEKGGYIAGKYLIEQGHTKIGYIENPHSLNGQKRIAGFKKALLEHHITVPPQLITQGDFSVESGYLAGDIYTRSNVSAVFTSNDLMAYGLIQNFRKREIKPMVDIEIVGYDNLFFTQLYDFPFASIDQNISYIGTYAFDLILKRMKDPTLPCEEICLSPKLSLNNECTRLTL